MKAALDDALILASWLEKRAFANHKRIQPRILQMLVFLAQYHYFKENKGEILMPSLFMAFQDGPREPNLYAIMGEFEQLPNVLPPPFQLIDFLDRFWARYDGFTADQLLQEIISTDIYKRSHKEGEGHIIDFFTPIDEAKHNLHQEDKQKVTLKDGRKIEKWKPKRHLHNH